MSAPKKVVVLLSGGLDSSLALAELLAKPLEEVERVFALIIDYNQSNVVEVWRAEQLCKQWKVPHIIHKVSLLTDSDAHAEIPARNLIFVSLAASIAIQKRYNCIAVGSEPEDVFTDSSQLFLNRMREALELFDLDLVAPVKNYVSKMHLVTRALDLGVPLHLVHPSHSSLIDGKCKPSSLFLDALRAIFPGAQDPVRQILTPLSQLQTALAARSYHLSYKKDSFFKAARIFNEHADSMFVGQQSSMWGIAQALSGIPRPRYMPYIATISSSAVESWILLDQVASKLGYKQAGLANGAYKVIAQEPDPRITIAPEKKKGKK